jgi:plasmid stabilization system protein ParE
MKLVFTKHANKRLIEISDYLYQQKCSKKFVVTYMNKFRTQLKQVLIQFPDSGTPTPEYGENVRRIVCQEYSFLYEVTGDNIVILTVFRENLP